MTAPDPYVAQLADELRTAADQQPVAAPIEAASVLAEPELMVAMAGLLGGGDG